MTDMDVEHFGRISGPRCICNGYSYAGHIEPGSVNPECPSCYPEGPDVDWLAHITRKVQVRKRDGAWVISTPRNGTTFTTPDWDQTRRWVGAYLDAMTKYALPIAERPSPGGTA